MTRAGRRLGRGARGDVLHGNVVDGDRDAILLAPVRGELVEPFVEGRDEMAPLHHRQRLALGERARDERLRHLGREHRRDTDTSALEEAPPRRSRANS